MSFAAEWARTAKSKNPEHRAKSAKNQAVGIFGTFGTINPESVKNASGIIGTFGTINKDSVKSILGNFGTFDTTNPPQKEQTAIFPGANSDPLPKNGKHRAKSANNRIEENFGTFGTVNRESENCTHNAAIEFLDMVKGGHAHLHTDGRGGLWWTSQRYADDPGSLSYIADVWEEAWPGLFRLLASGGLDHLLPKRTTTTALPLERPRRKRITPAMLERYRKARPWIEAHMPALLAQGWTRRTLFRAGRRPHPRGQWGLAWSSGWTSPHLARVGIGEDGVNFILDEPHRVVVQTARPKP